ncbi:methyltransferase GidB [Isoalcanivorax pacificus W11-5]|uniref:Ribosomal RNA small subunit methyltransferase G n=1 Tax=Isoalcanivorax pacificus W11-5 TaxID=391936 RepID=A0A0B4XUC0_9GAMM|nr:16S rRNA (guanine(527)-N(7))-methyltransferase RsmG [Isoalcanivorax pacificus]AJD50083.1 methyltransferase GidB [Isoalcanivorax pacificus W11-5]
MTLARQLADGIAALGLDIDDGQQQQLLAYVGLLDKWNKAFNLTAVRDPAEMVTRHLLDSLAVLPYLGTGHTLDVGTGAGLPGMVLAITRPAQTFTLLDSNGKKTRFVRQAALELGVTNVEVVQARVEQYRSESFQNGSPQVITRAFASLPDMLSLTGHLLADGGRLLAMKAAQADAETATVPAPWHAQCIALTVPGLNESRQLVMLERTAAQQPVEQG